MARADCSAAGKRAGDAQCGMRAIHVAIASSVIESLLDGLPNEFDRPDASHSMTSRSYSTRLAFVPCGLRRKSRPLSVTIAWLLCLCLRYFGTAFLRCGMCRFPLVLAKRNLPFVTKVNAALPNAGRQ